MANLADTLPEPADGTRLAVRDEKGVWWVVWRDDDAVAQRGIHPHPGERWFESWGDFPVSWHYVMENATEAYAIAEQPTAQIATDDGTAAKLGFEAWKQRVLADTPPKKFIVFNEQPDA